MRYCLLLISLPLVVLLQPANAAPVQFALSGTVHVNFHQGPLPDGIFEGAPWNGILTYDTDIPDSWPELTDEQRGMYVSDRISLRLDFGPTYFIPESDTTFLLVGNNLDWPQGELPPTPKFVWRGDSLVFQSNEFQTNSPYELGGIDLTWVDPSGTSFDSDSLPTLLQPGMFPMPDIDVIRGLLSLGAEGYSISASVNRIDLIPEPQSVLLLIAAAGLLLCVSLIRSSWTRSTGRVGLCCGAFYVGLLVRRSLKVVKWLRGVAVTLTCQLHDSRC
jgi:hypothetical protein